MDKEEDNLRVSKSTDDLIQETVISHTDGRRRLNHLTLIGCSVSKLICEIADANSAAGKLLQSGIVNIPPEV